MSASILAMYNRKSLFGLPIAIAGSWDKKKFIWSTLTSMTCFLLKAVSKLFHQMTITTVATYLVAMTCGYV